MPLCDVMLNDFASHRSLARSLSPTPFTPHVTMATPLLDKIHIAYNAPYALGNMLAPGCVSGLLSRSFPKYPSCIFRHPNPRQVRP